MEFRPPSTYVDVEELKKQISEEQLYRIYFPSFPDDVSVPWRVDKSPSLVFFQGRNDGKWMWVDKGRRGDVGNVYQLIQRMERLASLKDVFVFINQKFVLGLERRSRPQLKVNHIKVRKHVRTPISRTEMVGVRRKWQDYDERFWMQWDIEPWRREKFNLVAGQEFWIDDSCFHVNTPEDPLYYMKFPRSKHLKMYRPYAPDKKDKFRTNADNYTDVMGYDQCMIKLKPGRPLMLTKAMKEIIFYDTFGINAMAMHSETANIDQDFIRHLRKYCGPIILGYDNDQAGVSAACQISREFAIPRMFTCKAKNVTDLWLTDKRATFQFINQLIDEFHNIARAGIYSEYSRQLSAQAENGAF